MTNTELVSISTTSGTISPVHGFDTVLAVDFADGQSTIIERFGCGMVPFFLVMGGAA